MNSPASIDRYAVVGYPVKHSWSPFIHGLFARQTGQNLTYTRMEIAPENLQTQVADESAESEAAKEVADELAQDLGTANEDLDDAEQQLEQAEQLADFHRERHLRRIL